MGLNEVLQKYKPLDKGLAQERMDIFQSGLDAISTEHLSKSFGEIKAVDNLSISFPKSLVTALVGPNGSGKSTLIDLITGFLRPDNGSVIIEEGIYPFINSYDLRKFKISRTFQKVRLIKQLSVEDNLLLGVAQNTVIKSIMEQSMKSYQKKLDWILVKTGLKEYRANKAENLSYDQCKLLEIGRALMQDAEIYIFDEPFAGLSPKTAEEVFSIIDLLRVQAKTVILIEHDVKLIEPLADFIIALDRGTLLASGAPKDVLNKKLV